jgi:transaldolase
MKLFIDSADPKEILELAKTGLVDGVTTNPSLAAKSGLNIMESLKTICDAVPGSVSAEVLATDTETMIKQGEIFAKIAPNITVKVPCTWDGLKACRKLSDSGHKVNVTLCFQPVQALLAAKAGAYFISPFIGRLDDAAQDGMELIREIRHIYDNYDYSTQILAASIRSVTHIRDAALAGSDVATLPGKIFKQLLDHPLTDKGLASFAADAEKAHITVAALEDK